jgi:hypothetical protein
MKTPATNLVETTIGKKALDSTGSPVATARMNPAETYLYISKLLQEYINTGSEPAWQKIQRTIDIIYLTVSAAIESLEAASPFLAEVKKQVAAGKKLFFKPDIVTLPLIDYVHHGNGIPGANSHWEFVACVMRWFHDKGGITYHQMAVGEAGMTISTDTIARSKTLGRQLTPEAVMEGKYGDDYGGWGFYFTRKYLAECHDKKHPDNPMNGYQESLDGTCPPPGQAKDKLLFFNLNRLNKDNSRDVEVADGVNFKCISIHKAVIGGDPKDPVDMKDWPGCVLVDLPLLKIHVMELITFALKNVGMGIYAMEAKVDDKPGSCKWKYSIPETKVPFGKLKVPHARWSLQTDEDTLRPIRDSKGEFIWKRTGGMEATIADGINAVKGQKVMMLHIGDGIECTNIYHSGMTGKIVPEGYVFASLNPVAMDNCAAHYLFNMVPMQDTAKIQKKWGVKSAVIQKIPYAKLDGKNIVTVEGYDSCYSRYHAFQHCEERGIGKRDFYVTGKDLWQGGNLASVNGRLGCVENGKFTDLVTTTIYHASGKYLLDFQAGLLAYLELNDKLTGANHKAQLLKHQDENGDGVIDYLEGGKNAGSMASFAYNQVMQSSKADPLQVLKLRYLFSMIPAKWIHTEWNTEGLETGEKGMVGQAVAQAYRMSQSPVEQPDPLYPGRIWGNGKWPSLQYIFEMMKYARVYGPMFPGRIFIGMSSYGQAFAYADAKWNGGSFYNPRTIQKGEDIVGNYLKAVADGEKPLPFTMYVPEGYGSYNGIKYPNIVETDDPALIFTTDFAGKEKWNDIKLSDHPWLKTTEPDTVVLM